MLGYSFYYVLGYYVSRTIITKKQSVIIYIGGLAGFISTVLLSLVISMHNGEALSIFYNNFSVNVVLETLSVFVLIKNLLSNTVISDKKCKIISKLSKYSFGTYLVHALIITLLHKGLGLSSISFNTLIAIPVTSIIVFIISYVISAVLNHIPFVKKYLV